MSETDSQKKDAKDEKYTFWMSPGWEFGFAAGSLGLAVITVVWKTYGLGWLPFIGKPWDSMYRPQPGHAVAQYPRRDAPGTPGSNWWDLRYLIGYGFLGTASQLAGYWLARQERPKLKSERVRCQKSGGMMQKCARGMGIFYFLMSIHHVRWALDDKWGQLQVQKWNVAYPRTQAAIAAIVTGWAGLQAYLVTWKENPTVWELRRRTCICNAISIVGSIAGLGFWIENIIGVRSTVAETLMQQATLSAPVLVILYDTYVNGL
eukprot:CAMPEP_0174855542 /NCGR_PEP_ID=MMETSP1114-20130205/33496_1 /TAXON_ID=312471 /ORGANISM="Neobodo designis, Strain CCAP 1951/1" /LENGTH=261 /DNA_ID=CAMNT_0016090283 /DNA_START=45 /DNA_END=830 /DNA_ORIENTATION=-